MSAAAFFTLSVVLLAALLFWPVSRLVWVMSVRRLERKRGEPLAEGERHGQLLRARLLALALVIVFSLAFNLVSLGVPASG